MELETGLVAWKAIRELLSTIKTLNKDGQTIPAVTVQDLNDRILAAQEKAMSANSRIETLQERIRTLEAEKANLLDRLKDRGIYEPCEIIPGVPALRPKQAMTNPPQTEHYLCPTCDAKGEKSFLQITKLGPMQVVNCSRCGQLGANV